MKTIRIDAPDTERRRVLVQILRGGRDDEGRDYSYDRMSLRDLEDLLEFTLRRHARGQA
jgi:hypothetical protein